LPPAAQVTCGSSIKLQHAATKFRLHSHEVAYGRGSGQQSVTCYPESDDANSLWIVVGPPGAPCSPGAPVLPDQKLRLQHAATRKWLHSHAGYQSPISNNQEARARARAGNGGAVGRRDRCWSAAPSPLHAHSVAPSVPLTPLNRRRPPPSNPPQVSGHGDDSFSDGGDVWAVENDGGGAEPWTQAAKVRLRHVDTGAYLYSHDHKYGNPIAGQQEVCAAKRKDRNAEWTAVEGVYLSPRAAEEEGGEGAAPKDEL